MNYLNGLNPGSHLVIVYVLHFIPTHLFTNLS